MRVFAIVIHGGPDDGLRLLMPEAWLRQLVDGVVEFMHIEFGCHVYVADKADPFRFRHRMVREQPLHQGPFVPAFEQPPELPRE